MRLSRPLVYRLSATMTAGAAFFLGFAPTAHSYESWCDLIETHAPRIAVVSEPLRVDPQPRDIDRLNLLYNRVIPQLNTVAFATFWYPNVWGSPDVRSDTRSLLTAMDDLQDLANDGQTAASAVQAVDDAIAVLHYQCDGHRGLPQQPPPQ